MERGSGGEGLGMKIDEKLVQYEATLILRETLGIGDQRICNILNKLGFKNISVNTIKHWIYRKKAPRKTSPLIKGLFYHKAHSIVHSLPTNHTPRKIKKKLKEILNIWIPETTIRNWKNGAKPTIKPIKLCPELGYIIGVLLSDGNKQRALLRVRDKDFAENYAKALKCVLGEEYQIKEKDFYEVSARGSVLVYIIQSKLWKVIGFIYTKDFLQGLFDGDGSVNVTASKRFRIAVSFTNSNFELIDFVNMLLQVKYGIRTRINTICKDGQIIHIKNKEYKVKETRQIIIYRKEDIRKFFNEIGFRIRRKQKKLFDALLVQNKYGSGKIAVREWKKIYSKKNNKWIRASLTLHS